MADTAEPDSDPPGRAEDDLTMAAYNDNLDPGMAIELAKLADKDEDLRQLFMEEERHLESDIMLAEAYKEMAEASAAMAESCRETARALEDKIDAARREFQASTEVLRAQTRYEDAQTRIGKALAHRVCPQTNAEGF